MSDGTGPVRPPGTGSADPVVRTEPGGVCYGIDFGTSTSAIMVGTPDGAVHPVPDPAAPFSATLPTSVFWGGTGLAVGPVAERSRLGRPERYRREFKRHFGDEEPIRLGPGEFLPHELAAAVLAHLRALARARFPGEPGRVVIGVPASWERDRRELMLEAAALAGFATETVSLAAEPVAAAAHVYAAHPPLGPRTVFVYDLGGGTFDCCVTRDAPGGFAVLGSPGGLPDVGGVAFDRLILADVRARFPAESAGLLDPAATGPAVLRQRLELAEACEQLKIRLSDLAESHEAFPMLGGDAYFTLTRTEFEGLIEPLLAETRRESARLLDRLGLGWPDVDLIVPVGGGTRTPATVRRLYEDTRRRVLLVDDPGTAVVRGAVELARTHGRAAPPRTGAVPDPGSDLPELDPAGERAVPRPAGPDDVTVTALFRNLGDEQLRLCWLGYDGIPQLYSFLPAGTSVPQPTYPGHVWLVYAPDDSVRGVYLPEADCQVVFK